MAHRALLRATAILAGLALGSGGFAVAAGMSAPLRASVAQEAGETIEVAPGVSLTVLASEVIDALPTPGYGGWGLAFERVSLAPGETATEEPSSSDYPSHVQLLYVDDGQLVIEDESGEAAYVRGEQQLRTDGTGYEVRNATGGCGTLYRLTTFFAPGAGPFGSSASVPNLPALDCQPSGPDASWLAGVDKQVPAPVRFIMARLTFDPAFLFGWNGAFAGPVVLLVESGMLAMERSGETYFLPAGSMVLLDPDTAHAMDTRAGEETTVLVAGAVPGGRPLRDLVGAAPSPGGAPAASEPGEAPRPPSPLDGPADLAALLPTEAQVPQGLVLTQDVERTLAEVAANYGTPAETERLFETWGWRGNAARRFAAGGGLPASATTSLYVSIHRFGDAQAAARALDYSFENQAAATGALEVPTAPVGDRARALAWNGPGANEITLYVQHGDLLIRLSAASETGDPMADAQAVMATIVANAG